MSWRSTTWMRTSVGRWLKRSTTCPARKPLASDGGEGASLASARSGAPVKGREPLAAVALDFLPIVLQPASARLMITQPMQIEVRTVRPSVGTRHLRRDQQLHPTLADGTQHQRRVAIATPRASGHFASRPRRSCLTGTRDSSRGSSVRQGGSAPLLSGLLLAAG